MLGAWIAVSGLAGAFGHALDIVFLHERMQLVGTRWVPTSQWHWLFYDLVEMVAGVALLLGSRALTELLQRLRGRPMLESAAGQADTGRPL